MQYSIDDLRKDVNLIKAKPPWQLYLGGAVLLFIIIYIGWSFWGHKPPKPGTVVTNVPVAKEIEDMETTTTTTTITYIKNKEEAVKKLGLPASEASNPKEVLQTAGHVEPNKNGAVVAVFINRSTGKSKMDIKYNNAPWFKLERENTIGMGIGASTLDGYIGKVYLKRDIAQVKGIYMQVSGEAIIRPSGPPDRKVEAIGLINMEKRFNWP
jgi:hypothetical protein